MEAKWISIDKATEIYGGQFIRQFVEGEEYQYKIVGPSPVEGFIEILRIAKNGEAYPPDKRTSLNIAGWTLIERNYEILEEGLSPKNEWPTTLKEAIETLKKEIDDSTITKIKQMSKSDFVAEFYSLGQYIRNQFGLWRGNEILLHNVAPENPEPDNVSGIILDSFFEDIAKI